MLVLSVVAVAFALVLAVGRLATTVLDSAAAQSAADAAALAGATGGASAAARVATANGATLVTFTVLGEDVLVTVDLRGVRASARATVASDRAP